MLQLVRDIEDRQPEDVQHAQSGEEEHHGGELSEHG